MIFINFLIGLRIEVKDGRIHYDWISWVYCWSIIGYALLQINGFDSKLLKEKRSKVKNEKENEDSKTN